MVAADKTGGVTMYCRKCLYNLTGLEKPRCPECGRQFDPADGTTYLTGVMESARHYKLAGFGALAMTVSGPGILLGGRFLQHFGVPVSRPIVVGMYAVLLAAGYVLALSVFLAGGARLLVNTPCRDRRSLWAGFGAGTLVVLGLPLVILAWWFGGPLLAY